MQKLNLQLFGGRGANSGYAGGRSTGGGSRGVSRFYDKTKEFKGMSIHEFENAIRDKKTEYIGIFDKDGNLIVAGTSNNKGSVAIPSNAPGFKNGYTLTHNHPYDGGRIIGGSFSEADVQNHLALRFKGETRAVTNGPNENTYIFRAKRGVKQNSVKMSTAAAKVGSQYPSEAKKTLTRVKNRLAKQGKSLNGKDNQVYIGTAKRLWKKANVERYGYEYINVTKKRW